MSVEFKDNSQIFLEEMKRRLPIALEAIGQHLEGEAKEELENSPRRVDTGLLRNSITHAMSGEAPAISSYHGDNSSKYSKVDAVPIGYYSGTAPSDPEDSPAVYIGTNVEYAQYVHDGTSRMNPNRFLKNACQRNKEQIKQYLENELKG